MNLREWVSNKQEVCEIFSEGDKTDVETMKVLGHQWNVKKDELSYKISESTDFSAKPTKRSVLKSIASVFDPLGLVSPVTLLGKCFLQTLWRKRISWDDILVDDDCQIWFSIKKNIEQLTQCNIPRCISPDKTPQTVYHLVCFCDASEKAYAATVYLHQSRNGLYTSHLIFAKTRVAPVKSLNYTTFGVISLSDWSKVS